MAKRELTVNEQVRKLNQQQQAICRKLRRLAPAGTIEFTPSNDGTLLTWQSVREAVRNATDSLDELAEDSIIDDLIQADNDAVAKSLTAVE